MAELPTSDGRPAIYIIFNVSDFLHICPYAETHRVRFCNPRYERLGDQVVMQSTVLGRWSASLCPGVRSELAGARGALASLCGCCKKGLTCEPQACLCKCRSHALQGCPIGSTVDITCFSTLHVVDKRACYHDTAPTAGYCAWKLPKLRAV